MGVTEVCVCLYLKGIPAWGLEDPGFYSSSVSNWLCVSGTFLPFSFPVCLMRGLISALVFQFVITCTCV